MIKFRLNKELKERLESFFDSDFFTNQSSHSKSEYWKYHSAQISYKLEDSYLYLTGASGNYIPDRKHSYQFYLRSIKTFIKKILGLDTAGPDSSFFLSFKKAFNKVMNENRVAGYQQIKFNKDKILFSNFSECKKKFPFSKFTINDHIIRSYYYINILSSYLDFKKNLTILEIGAGNGNLISLIKSHLGAKCILNIDLPETLVLSITYLTDLFPNLKFLLPHEINSKIDKDKLDEFDFIFLTPNQINLIDENLIDLSINTSSFHEMSKQQIEEYIHLIQKISKSNSYFFNTNSVEKIPHDGSRREEEYKKIVPIRFFEYPFFDNEILIYQICRFTNFVQHIPFYLRLEKIKK
tara:strand:+ start:3133 stop:4188 length:1056 start_codon:yes stop_codon:yes gene_type:complete